ncbi:hypothetical protein ASD28_17380 [Massilia sp. Root133]|nr:hypothetical protein ASD28_17380 [Massilia sp. Root133]KQZ52571.1 hypothetical protein ASD92_18810 [Massilia sp. Root1485]
MRLFAVSNENRYLDLWDLHYRTSGRVLLDLNLIGFRERHQKGEYFRPDKCSSSFIFSVKRPLCRFP